MYDWGSSDLGLTQNNLFTCSFGPFGTIILKSFKIFRGRFRVFKKIGLLLQAPLQWIRIRLRPFWNSFWEGGIVWTTYEQVLWNSVKNSVFSRLCHISLITFLMILQLIERYIWTIWNSFKAFEKLPRKIPCFQEHVIFGEVLLGYSSNWHRIMLRPFRIIFKILIKFRGFLSRSPSFPKNVVTGLILLRIRNDLYIGILRPFGSFWKSSAEFSACVQLFDHLSWFNFLTTGRFCKQREQ